MARLLVKAIDDFLPVVHMNYGHVRRTRHGKNQVITIYNNRRSIGPEENLVAWEALGLDPADWNGMFYVVSVPEIPDEKLGFLINEGVTDRSIYTLDLNVRPGAWVNMTPLQFREIVLLKADGSKVRPTL